MMDTPLFFLTNLKRFGMMQLDYRNKTRLGSPKSRIEYERDHQGSSGYGSTNADVFFCAPIHSRFNTSQGSDQATVSTKSTYYASM